MAIVNRTPDSFFRPGDTWDESAAMERVHQAVAEGADIVDIGGGPTPRRPGGGSVVGSRAAGGVIAAVPGREPGPA